MGNDWHCCKMGQRSSCKRRNRRELQKPIEQKELRRKGSSGLEAADGSRRKTEEHFGVN